MKNRLVFLGAIATLAISFQVTASHGSHSQVMYAEAIGRSTNPNVKASMVFLTLPSGDHEVYVRVSGLQPNSGVYANHLHFSNQISDPSCEGQNGEDAIPFKNLVADAKGAAINYTLISAMELPDFPKSKFYFNIHSNKPNPVGDYIACGNATILPSSTK